MEDFGPGRPQLLPWLRDGPDGRINRDNDLRSKLDRKRSPIRRSSPRSDAKGLRSYNRSSPSQITKRRKTKTYEHMDGPNDFPGSFKSLEGLANSRKDQKLMSSNTRVMLEDELKQIQYEVDMLSNQKRQLETEMEERVLEADSLSSRIRDLEAQLSGEKDKSKRVNSKIKRLIRACVHHSRLQDEIKRSQVELEQLVGELGTDAIPMVDGEGELNVDIISDEEVLELKGSASPVRKQLHSSMGTPKVSKSAKSLSVHGVRVPDFKKNSLVHSDGHQEAEAEVGIKRKVIARPTNENKPQLHNNALITLEDKQKASEYNIVAPPTSVAAYADDEFVELFETEENLEVAATPKVVKNGLPFPLPPLPIVSQNNYFQYEGDDESVDVDGLEGLEELEDVDIV